MTSYINVKNKQGMTKLASLIKQAGFNDVKVTVQPNKSITLTPGKDIDLRAGLSDLKAGRYTSFKSMEEAVGYLDKRSKKVKKSVTRRK